MNELPKNKDDLSNMDHLGQLIKLAGAREAVDSERFERVHENVKAHWQKVVEEHKGGKQHRWLRVYAVAASVVLAFAITVVLWNLTMAPGMTSLAAVDRVLGEVTAQDERVAQGSDIHAGTSITTGRDGRIGLRMTTGQSLRIDTDSRVIFRSPELISLESGAVYIDTAFAEEAEPMMVSTPLGTAKDIGTQFQVRVEGKTLVVGVRQGLVEVARAGQEILAVKKGTYLMLGASGEREQKPLPTDDPNWEWIEAVSPEFEIQDATLEEYLLWYANERGLELVWSDKKSELNARTALLTGSIAGSGLDDGLKIVKLVAPFEHQVSGEKMLVRVE